MGAFMGCRSLMRRLSYHRGEGQELVELALVLPVLLLIFLFIIDFAVMAFKKNTVYNAAREGARAGVIQVVDGFVVDEAYIEGIVLERLLALNLSDSRVEVTLTVDTVDVTVTHTATLMTGPMIEVMGGTPNVRMQSVSTMNRE
jgi:Flp pilus assembly protein TadG